MLIIAILFVVLVCQCQGLPQQEPDTATIQHDALGDKLASLLREHEATTVSLLKSQEVKTAFLLKEQETKLADLTSLLLDQGLRLSDQEHLLQQQGLLLRQQKKLLDQEDFIRHQDQKLSHQDILFHEQFKRARLSYQEALLQQQGRTIRELKKNRHVPPQSFSSQTLHPATNTSQPKTHLTRKTSDSTSHDVIPCSDDMEPLQTVVSQLSQRVTEMGADIQTLKNSNRQQDLAIQDAQSSAFVHWGSSTCSDLSHTVYSGVVGGSWYHQSGAATNYLCLTMSPVISDHPLPGAWASLNGGEYETWDSHENRDPVCAVCRSTLSTTVMIPGTNVCTPGWHLQYSGFLMAGWYGHEAGTEYICVDSKLENNARGNANENGKLLYFTVTHCGSLPCTPYVNNTVVTCAVCSK